ncbi:MAG: ATP-binding protein [Syntrophomonadaceae bacterium]|nr:ATP-binding protein [Syntrophomonadaceae bacterium]
MQVVGKTNERDVWVASKDRPFRLNELLVVEGHSPETAVGEVVETYSLNPLVPLVDEGSPYLMGHEIVSTLRDFGYELERDTVYLGKIRVISELFYPVKTGSQARVPDFAEVADLLVQARPEQAMALGVILGTDTLDPTLPEELRGLAPLFEDGKVVQQQGVPFLLDYRRMQDYPHIGIFGGSGSGKSFGIRVLIEEFMKKRLPVIVFDPHYEMSFSDPLLPDLPPGFRESFDTAFRILTVGQDVGVRFDLLNEGDLCNLLGAVSPLSEAMESTARAVLMKNDSLATFAERLDNLIELMENNEADYRQEFFSRGSGPDREREWKRLKVLQNQVGQPASLRAIRWRLHSLKREGIFNQAGIARIEEGLRNRQVVVVRGSIRMLRVYASYVLRHLYGKRREYRDAMQKGQSAEGFPPFLVVTDEAHNFAPKGDHTSPSLREFREIAQEGRKYGVFLVLASQRPALLDDTINAQLNTKIIFRTVRSMDLSVISEETDLGREEIRRLPYLPSGYSFISSPIVGRTVAVRIRAAKTRSPHQDNPFDELAAMADARLGEFRAVLDKYLPLNETYLNDVLQELENRGIRMTRSEMDSLLEQMVERGELIKDDTSFVTVYRPARQ